MSFLKRILSGHGGGHGGGHGNGGHGGGHHGGQRRDGHGGHDARGRDRHGWGWQAPADSRSAQGGGNVPLSQLACAGCGALNATDARFCAQCGAAQRGKSCSRCHSALAADARFCPGCGTQAV
ncbi:MULTISPECIES: zinc ribbon domain-containing protein [unclassified Burkholderia]|uniref:zinc ribbon domain-containing protein n=1 Tax=unclassified Burkholderia TaxID=2613784 RepID=UPI001423171E|nr:MULTISPECIES: zinc ribbon domain-containing protein [unclassified Burkholderia]NIE61433.1 zinc ribbon domain-containing protein [Burkholderia sp. Ap-955]NIF13943.1 zinc ribbon domain-containing protein [Burkholderia sp. Ax-1735]NIG07126.1 zinc ribbon domain-containing protein [Burkholderia sp. Tr-849]